MKFYEEEYNPALITTQDDSKLIANCDSKECYLPLGHDISLSSLPDQQNKNNSENGNHLFK
jgi:hypothetical protein